jgi:hypothetical protein
VEELVERDIPLVSASAGVFVQPLAFVQNALTEPFQRNRM